jgi:hypothetical protein
MEKRDFIDLLLQVDRPLASAQAPVAGELTGTGGCRNERNRRKPRNFKNGRLGHLLLASLELGRRRERLGSIHHQHDEDTEIARAETKEMLTLHPDTGHYQI